MKLFEAHDPNAYFVDYNNELQFVDRQGNLIAEKAKKAVRLYHINSVPVRSLENGPERVEYPGPVKISRIKLTDLKHFPSVDNKVSISIVKMESLVSLAGLADKNTDIRELFSFDLPNLKDTSELNKLSKIRALTIENCNFDTLSQLCPNMTNVEFTSCNLESIGNNEHVKIEQSFKLKDIYGLKNLKGCPQHIQHKLVVMSCRELTSLAGCPSHVGLSIFIHDTGITSPAGLPDDLTLEDTLDLTLNKKLKLSIDDLVKIFNINGELPYYIRLDDKVQQEIINKHLADGKNLFGCQAELIEAGYGEFE